jgi:heme O synthase-like polyprenyltransferase
MIKSKLKNRNLSQEDVFNFSELFKLMKPRVMSLVIFTCAVGLLMAPNIVPTKEAIIGIILVSIGAGAAGALNMWYESDLDALMTRTCLRPIPTGKVNRNQALVFGITLSIFSVIALDFFANRISAGLLLVYYFILCACLHNLAKEKNTTKHSYWWCRRCFTSSYRLDYSNKFSFIRTNYIFFNNFLLDPISFLGIELIQIR